MCFYVNRHGLALLVNDPRFIFVFLHRKKYYIKLSRINGYFKPLLVCSYEAGVSEVFFVFEGCYPSKRGACNDAGMLGIFHGVSELGPILHVVACMLARALIGPPMGRIVSMAVAAAHAVWGGVGGDGRAAVAVAIAAAVAIAVLGKSGQCRNKLRARQF
jgi:hypothetical protein